MESRTNSTWKPTTKTDLIKILRNCNQCYESNHHGKFIIAFNELNSLNSKQLKKNKITNIIVNAHHHWFLLSIFWRQNFLIISDSLNTISTDSNVMKYINEFCQKHKLKPLFFSTNYQLLSSSNCGQLSCALMAVINTRKSLIKLFKFRKTLLNNSVEKNEQYLLSLLKKHF